jgi:hypothetical protein
MFKILARINKVILPSFSKQQMNKAKMANGNHWLPLLCYNPCFTLISDRRKNLIFLNFFLPLKRFPLRNSTGRFHRLIPPPIHKRFGRATGSEDIIMNKYLSPLWMASVCISSVSVPYSSS